MLNVNFIPNPDEKVELARMCNHFKGLEGVGGKLFVTDQRLVFKSHDFNFQTHQLDLNYEDIASIELSNTLGLVPNGLTIKTKQGQVERFVIWRRKAVKQKVKEKMAAVQKKQ